MGAERREPHGPQNTAVEHHEHILIVKRSNIVEAIGFHTHLTEITTDISMLLE
ncbi:hypothetical protein [Microvirga sp. 17 mud 1-3]|uniref:hypothetical protein n=1 Tax=Microvirga sp. 17 mud 1-3 TaxID=2082949 RepID=UPI0013A59CB0|nr:hypothetical protein [Microvirga sp. 17 mud 1-3]